MTKHARSELEIAKAVESLRSIHIRARRDKEFRRHLDRLLQRDDQGRLLPKPIPFTADGETRGLPPTGGPGDGKTHLAGHTLRSHPALGEREGDSSRRYLAVRVPSPATLKSLVLGSSARAGTRRPRTGPSAGACGTGCAIG